MREFVQQVCALQVRWEANNTPEMRRRGELIRHAIPEWFSSQTSTLSKTANDIFAEGRDGTGQKTEIPWARIASRSRSPSAQSGWYLVYLFEALGNGVYLALAHGSTDFVDGMFRPKSPEEISKFMAWARGHLADDLLTNPHLTEPMELNARRSKLGAAYEQTTLLAKWYPSNALPSDNEFVSDLAYFGGFLKKLYDAEDLGQAPNRPAPEVEDVIAAVNPTKRKRNDVGQGMGLSQSERDAVEAYSMLRAREVLEAKGFQVTDVSATQSFDYSAQRGDKKLFVEVKGTTTLGEQVLLTKNEVALHKDKFPDNALIVVHSINLDRNATPPVASGGNVIAISPWSVEDEDLTPLTYQCRVHRKLSDG